jgi:hypothetical protein
MNRLSVNGMDQDITDAEWAQIESEEHHRRINEDFKEWVEENFKHRSGHAISKGSEEARKATACAIGAERIREDSFGPVDSEGPWGSDLCD